MAIYNISISISHDVLSFSEYFRVFLTFHVVNRAFNSFALENTKLRLILYRLYDPALHTDEHIAEQIQVDK